MKETKKKPAILVILGPTASGKSDLAVTLAKKLNGEVVSADSRQVYKGLDIGTGKITKKEMKGIPHYLLDVASPKDTFTVDLFQKHAYQVINNIISRGKLPIICGGTGFYIQSIVDGIILPNVPPNKILRIKLASHSTEKLFSLLTKIDPKRAKDMKEKNEQNNKVRIVRALEIAKALGASPKIVSRPKYNSVQIGLKWSDELTKKRISLRLVKRIKAGMIKEAETLHVKGLPWKRMEQLGLEYRYLAYYLQNKISKEEMIRQLELLIWQYAKRQMTWFKKDQRIAWVEVK
jgi:tRNA dimethylallyltransferase